jgi:hypothetical protein
LCWYAPLENEAETICELQNVFYQKLGSWIWEPNDNLFAKCKILASKCYLETMPFMLDAQNYTKVGFNTFVLLWEKATRVALLDAEEFMILVSTALDLTKHNKPNSSK